MSKVVAFVPIKLNSERVPGKNIRKFSNGKPLIKYILTTISEIEIIDEVYVYCSSDKIKEYLPDNVKFLKRDPYYDLSTTSFNEVLSSFANEIEASIYVLTHATAPFIKKESIEIAIKQVLSHDYDSALAVTKMQEFIWKNNKPFNYNVESIPRTQDLEPLFIETCGLYVYTRELILKENRRIGYNPFLVEVSKIEACDINIEEDFIIADAISQILDNK